MTPAHIFSLIIVTIAIIAILCFIGFLIWLIVDFIAFRNKFKLPMYLTLGSLGVIVMAMLVGHVTVTSYENNGNADIWSWQSRRVDKVTHDEAIVAKALNNPTEKSIYNGYVASEDLVVQVKKLPDSYATKDALSSAQNIQKVMKEGKNAGSNFEEWQATSISAAIANNYRTINGSYANLYMKTKDSGEVYDPRSKAMSLYTALNEDGKIKAVWRGINKSSDLLNQLADSDDNDDYDLDY
ncbi:hypothetical protein [Furfurilactobacillus entadae]|uniref:hypothetical protein n=1 Tax=Furfurilactobacillus entadae TaxID=2922307 RepID=UPI0035E78170